MNEHLYRKITAARPNGHEINIFEIKKLRNKLLAQSDWTQMPDNALSAEKRAEWAAYRQALRDLPAQGVNATWPQKPE